MIEQANNPTGECEHNTPHANICPDCFRVWAEKIRKFYEEEAKDG